MVETAVEILNEVNVQESSINPSVSPFCEREKTGDLPPSQGGMKGESDIFPN